MSIPFQPLSHTNTLNYLDISLSTVINSEENTKRIATHATVNPNLQGDNLHLLPNYWSDPPPTEKRDLCFKNNICTVSIQFGMTIRYLQALC